MEIRKQPKLMTKSAEVILEEFSDENIGYTFRFIQVDDYNKGYFGLLSQLTTAPECSYDDFRTRLELIEEYNNIMVIVVEKDEMIIGTISLVFEPKFIRKLGVVCHVEDVVVDENHRNLKLGSKMVNVAKKIAKARNCYKIILDCNDNAKQFYEKNNFEAKSSGMALYLD